MPFAKGESERSGARPEAGTTFAKRFTKRTESKYGVKGAPPRNPGEERYQSNETPPATEQDTCDKDGGADHDANRAVRFAFI